MLEDLEKSHPMWARIVRFEKFRAENGLIGSPSRHRVGFGHLRLRQYHTFPTWTDFTNVSMTRLVNRSQFVPPRKVRQGHK
ncbi:hypothetical protein Q1695_000108 [Nippostrongylus brasiliensis]|nr:hypothetical protein Q1695_000108 [Nippostrongylus brasiliensis]